MSAVVGAKKRSLWVSSVQVSFFLVVLACSARDSIAVGKWVIILEHLAARHEVVPRPIVPAMIAAEVTLNLGTVNKLLLKERRFPVFYGPCWLISTGGRESPAWTAVTLIFDRVHFASGDPVDFVGDGGVGGDVSEGRIGFWKLHFFNPNSFLYS